MSTAINDNGLSLTFTLRRAAVTTCSRRVVGPDKAPTLRWRADLRECSTPHPWLFRFIECLRQPLDRVWSSSTYPRIHVSFSIYFARWRSSAIPLRILALSASAFCAPEALARGGTGSRSVRGRYRFYVFLDPIRIRITSQRTVFFGLGAGGVYNKQQVAGAGRVADSVR